MQLMLPPVMIIGFRAGLALVVRGAHGDGLGWTLPRSALMMHPLSRERWRSEFGECVDGMGVIGGATKAAYWRGGELPFAQVVATVPVNHCISTLRSL